MMALGIRHLVESIFVVKAHHKYVVCLVLVVVGVPSGEPVF
jgi:hypothetical protein